MAESTTPQPGIDPALHAKLQATGYRMTLAHGVEAAREAALQMAPPQTKLPQLRIEERRIATGLPVRIYWPSVKGHHRLPIVLYYHGGGWTICDLDTHDATARSHAIKAEAIVVSVDYRRAPEHRYPAAVDDSWAALQWVAAHATELGGDPTRIAVAGDSAGGNLSAVMTQLARDNGGPSLAFQLLWYPSVTADRLLPSFTENAHTPLLDTDAVLDMWVCYHPQIDLDQPTSLPVTLVPANASSMAGLPPAYVATAEHDPLRDDGARYADLLRADGVEVELQTEPGLTHDFLSFALDVAAAADAEDRGLAALRTALH